MSRFEPIAISDDSGVGHVCTAHFKFVAHFDRAMEDVWQEAAQGTLNRAPCETCGRTLYADRPFLYTDLRRHIALMVSPLPGGKPAIFPEDTSEFHLDLCRLGKLSGLDEFQQFLWMTELGIDGATLGEIKHYIDVKNPLNPTEKAGLRLVIATDDEVFFSIDVATKGADSKRPSIPRSRVRAVANDRSRNAAQVADRRSRRRRFISDRSSQQLQLLAAAGSEAKKITQVLQGDASHVRDELTDLAADLDVAASAQLFQEISGVQLSPALVEQLAKAPADRNPAAKLWEAFAELPEQLRGKSVLSLEAIELDPAPGAVPAAFIPHGKADDIDKIMLSFGIVQSGDFAHALRHEIAHAIHELCSDQVNAWLADHFGWKIFALPPDWQGDPLAAVDAWIEELGGWKKAAPRAVSDEAKRRHRIMIWTACRPGTSSDGISMCSALIDTENPAWYPASYAQQIHLKTGCDWWKRATDWFEVPPPAPAGASAPQAERRLAFMNYRYRELVTVHASSRDLVARDNLLDIYALMSHREFFAEFYATWHEPGNRLGVLGVGFEELLKSLTPSQIQTN